jgi:hypothetical protein
VVVGENVFGVARAPCIELVAHEKSFGRELSASHEASMVQFLP